MNNQQDLGDYLVINGKRLNLKHHPTDFSALAREATLGEQAAHHDLAMQPLAADVTRLHAHDRQERDVAMGEIRQETVAHHIYEVEETGEEIIIDDRILVRLAADHAGDEGSLQAILDEYHLVDAGQMGDTHVLKVTAATGRNPVKVANEIAERPNVLSSTPHVRVPMERHRTVRDELPVLFPVQWYLTADLINDPAVDPRADIQVPEAWQITTGDPAIVLAVLDDGYDLAHPAFQGKLIDPAAKDFAATPQDNDPSAEAGDFHGTPVASLATGSSNGDAMIGVAPDCTLLPLRLACGLFDQMATLAQFRHASQYADVLNCSFGFPPLSFDLFDQGFKDELTAITRTGGRRGLGLVIVFSAGNDDAPTRLSGAENLNGVRFRGSDPAGNPIIRMIPPGSEIFPTYPGIEGVIAVSAISSRLRKAGYSNWGDDIAVGAPSSNGHELRGLSPLFNADYRGLGQIAAINRPGHGSRIRPLNDNLATTDVREDFYTANFGGTSGAAPLVSGVAALMLSVNPQLTAADLCRMLMATADTDLDPMLDLANDPNLQGLTGEFVRGRSRFFGGGKVNALRAVTRAQALTCGRRRANGVAQSAAPVVQETSVAPNRHPPLFATANGTAQNTTLDGAAGAMIHVVVPQGYQGTIDIALHTDGHAPTAIRFALPAAVTAPSR